MKRIGGTLEGLLGRLDLVAPMHAWQAVSLWSEVAGDRIAAHSAAVGMREGTLFVEVDSASWINEITYSKRRLLRGLNRELGDEVVRDIRLKPRQEPPVPSSETPSPVQELE